MAEPQEAKPDASSKLPKEATENGNAPSSSEPVKAAVDKDLPVVEAPKLDGSAVVMPPAVEALAEISDAMATEEAAEETAGAGVLRPSRYALLAAGIALAAALGSFVGSLSASGFAQLWPQAPAKSGMADTSALQAMKLELAELAALKASLDGATRSANGQLAKIADRLERVERAGSEPATKLTHIAEAVDRLEKKSAAAAMALEATGAIAANEAAPIEPKITDRILEGWIVQEVRHGRALVESRYGGAFVVTAGSFLPGLGRVEAIKRQDGQWVVVTARGLITSGQ